MSDKEEFFISPDEDAGPEKVNTRRKGGFYRQFFFMMLLGVVFLVACLVVIDLTNSGGPIKKRLITLLGGEATPAPPPAPRVVERIVEVPVETVVEKIVEKTVEVEVEPPMPSSYVSWKKVDAAELWSEIPVETRMETNQGETATVERERDESYRIEMSVNLTIPKPSDSVEELAEINPDLPKMLSDFDELIENSEVSPFYHHLYELKVRRVQEKVTRIDQLLSRHNLYDCETVLQAKHPVTGKKVLIIQGEMDVVTDGSDGDRWPELDDYISMSQYYQPGSGLALTGRKMGHLTCVSNDAVDALQR
ncbi:MAG: hypothetical protein AAGA96_20540, partial [Verrucomicrobiota bacterium]